MENTSLLSFAITNLRKSQTFLAKVMEVCERIAPGRQLSADEESRRAVALLLEMTDAVLVQAEHCRVNGGTFSARQILADTLADAGRAAPSSESGNTRMRIVMDMCLEQGEIYRRRAVMLESELLALREAVKAVYADLLAARAALEAPTRSGRNKNLQRSRHDMEA